MSVHTENGRKLFGDLVLRQTKFLGHEEQVAACAAILLEEAAQFLPEYEGDREHENRVIFARAEEALVLISIMTETYLRERRGGFDKAEQVLWSAVIAGWVRADEGESEQKKFGTAMLSRKGYLADSRWENLLIEGMKNVYGAEKFLRLVSWAGPESDKWVVKTALKSITRSDENHNLIVLLGKLLLPLYDIQDKVFLGSCRGYIETMARTFKAMRKFSLPFVPGGLKNAGSPDIEVEDESLVMITYRFGITRAGELTGNEDLHNWIASFAEAVRKWRLENPAMSQCKVRLWCRLVQIQYERIEPDADILDEVERMFMP